MPGQVEAEAPHVVSTDMAAGVPHCGLGTPAEGGSLGSPLSLCWCGRGWGHNFFLWFLASVDSYHLKVFCLARMPLSRLDRAGQLCFSPELSQAFLWFVPTGISRGLTSSASRGQCMRQSENPGSSPLCSCSGPTFPSLSAFSLLLFSLLVFVLHIRSRAFNCA